MATSHNGWPVIEPGTGGLWALPAVSGSVKAGPVWVVMAWLAREYAARVEPIVKTESWGYAYRKITGGSSLYSNHASGTAVDLNAPTHPYGTSATSNFTVAQIKACEEILAEAGGILKWLRGSDPMHWEITPGVQAPAVERLATRILQRVLGLTDDGIRGPLTDGTLRTLQRAAGLTDDGIDGPATWAALTARKTPTNPKETPVTEKQADRIIELLETIAQRALVTADALTVGKEGVKFDGDVITTLKQAAAPSAALTATPVTLDGTLTLSPRG